MAITPPGAGTFTALHFAILALLILATLAVITAGVRRSRVRRAAEQRVEAEAVEAGVPDGPMASAPVMPRAEAPALDRPSLDRAPPPPLADHRPVAVAPRDAEPDHRPQAEERIAVAAPADAGPATIAEPAPASESMSPADGPVTQLKGLGPKVAARLAELGLHSVGQIAALDADRAAAVDAQLGPFAGRLHRDRWVEQARFLAAGDRAGFEAVFGRL
jgi:predicted flap endonuclease-1-like 5' DNA nuclease